MPVKGSKDRSAEVDPVVKIYSPLYLVTLEAGIVYSVLSLLPSLLPINIFSHPRYVRLRIK